MTDSDYNMLTSECNNVYIHGCFFSEKTFHNTCKLSTECLETLFCIHGVCKCDRLDYWNGHNHNCSASKAIFLVLAKLFYVAIFILCKDITYIVLNSSLIKYVKDIMKISVIW